MYPIRERERGRERERERENGFALTAQSAVHAFFRRLSAGSARRRRRECDFYTGIRPERGPQNREKPAARPKGENSGPAGEERKARAAPGGSRPRIKDEHIDGETYFTFFIIYQLKNVL